MEEDHGEMFLSLLATIAVSSGTTAAHKYKHKTKYGLWRKQNEKAADLSRQRGENSRQRRLCSRERKRA